jgi:hypothetical protein
MGDLYASRAFGTVDYSVDASMNVVDIRHLLCDFVKINDIRWLEGVRFAGEMDFIFTMR